MEIVDTFPAFERFWASVERLPIPLQVERWRSDYMAAWPELLRKQQDEYRHRGVSWQKIARKRIFPKIPERLARLRRLHANLRRELPGAWKRTRAELRVDFPVRFVIYVGIGCGAGWATRFEGKPAVLFGLENAAEMTAGRRGEWAGSVYHEVAHLVHTEWRHRARLPALEELSGPYWHLFEEGFATECERTIAPAAVFRLRTGRADWLPWCERHKAQLAQMFLRDVRARRSVRRFFGSWFNIQGHVECGYFLGAEAVRELKRSSTIEEIARLDSPAVRRKMKESLTRLAEDARPGRARVRRPS
jgi:hypothetical protein